MALSPLMRGAHGAVDIDERSGWRCPPWQGGPVAPATEGVRRVEPRLGKAMSSPDVWAGLEILPKHPRALQRKEGEDNTSPSPVRTCHCPSSTSPNQLPADRQSEMPRVRTLSPRLKTPLSRLEALLSRLEALLSRLETLLSRLDALLRRLDALLRRLTALSPRLKAPLRRLEVRLSRYHALSSCGGPEEGGLRPSASSATMGLVGSPAFRQPDNRRNAGCSSGCGRIIACGKEGEAWNGARCWMLDAGCWMLDARCSHPHPVSPE